jgi:urea transport system substrate-binding protein
VAGEVYVPLTLNTTTTSTGDVVSAQIEDAVTQLLVALPTGGVILNTINGEGNVLMFKSLQSQLMALGYTSSQAASLWPVMSLSIAEAEVADIGTQYTAGMYAAWNYFQSIASTSNTAFLQTIWNALGSNTLVTDPAEAAWINVAIWRQSVLRASSFDIDTIRISAIDQSYDAPEGLVRMNANHHLSKRMRIGQIGSDGQFLIVHTVNTPILPEPCNLIYFSLLS